MPSSASTPKSLPAGIYCPTITFFLDTPEQELDLDTFDKHMEFLAKAGLQGVVVQGSTAEAVALDREERKTLIRVAKDAFRRVGNPGAIIAGTVGAQSTREVIQLSQDAAEAGADFTLTLPPSYFPAMMTPAAIQAFYEEVADKTPLPVIIYSYPGVCSGIQMDTDLTVRLAKHPNIAGIKHTDHEVGRIAREAAQMKQVGCKCQHHMACTARLVPALGESAAELSASFTILGGASDYLLGGLAVGGEGAIAGMANVAPRVISRAFELFRAGKPEEALKYSSAISKAEWAMSKGSILGTKANGYPAKAAKGRRPLLDVLEPTKAHIDSAGMEIVELERALEKEGYTGQGLRAPASTKANGANGH